MAKSKAEFVAEGRASYNHPLRDRGLITDTTMPLFGEGSSWQAKAFAEGWKIEHHLAEDRKRQECPACAAGVPLASAPVLAKVVGGPDDGRVVQLSAKAVQSIARTAGETLDAGHKAHAEQVARMVPENKRAERINKMARGYEAAALWSSSGTTPDGEDLENLDDYEFSEKAQNEAWNICAAFYDRYTTDVNAYAGTYQPSDGSDPYECAGHDLWLTTAGHGVGFWDRGLGRLGDRLSKACGFGTDFPQKDAYIGDDGQVYLA